MARRLRIQYSDAIYHIMARGNGRQDIVQDDADRGRLVACLERAVRRSGWSLYAFVFLTNHLHLVLQTPRPNLAKGMQLFLSSYANGWARRHRHCGHLFQGRYRTELVEDELRVAPNALPRASGWLATSDHCRHTRHHRALSNGCSGNDSAARAAVETRAARS